MTHFIRTEIQTRHYPISLLEKMRRTNQECLFPSKCPTKHAPDVKKRVQLFENKSVHSNGRPTLQFEGHGYKFVLNLLSFHKCIYKSLKKYLCLIMRSIFVTRTTMVIAKEKCRERLYSGLYCLY